MVFDFQEPLTREEEEIVDRIHMNESPFAIQQAIREAIERHVTGNQLIAQEVQ